MAIVNCAAFPLCYSAAGFNFNVANVAFMGLMQTSCGGNAASFSCLHILTYRSICSRAVGLQLNMEQ